MLSAIHTADLPFAILTQRRFSLSHQVISNVPFCAKFEIPLTLYDMFTEIQKPSIDRTACKYSILRFVNAAPSARPSPRMFLTHRGVVYSFARRYSRDYLNPRQKPPAKREAFVIYAML